MKRWTNHRLALACVLVTVLASCTTGQAPDALRPPPSGLGQRGYGPAMRAGPADAEFVTGGSPDPIAAGETLVRQIPVGRYFSRVGRARLTMRLWLIEPGANPDAPSAQRHRLSLNGHALPDAVTGIVGRWSVFSAEVPPEWVRLPAAPGQGGATPEPAPNEVSLSIQSAEGSRASQVFVDWLRLELDGPRPWVLIHGFKSDASIWKKWQRWAGAEDIPTYAFSFANSQGSMWDHADELAGEVAKAKTKFGVTQVNLVGVSKGAVDARVYLSRGGSDVEHTVSLGGPFGGSELADIAKAGEALPGGSLISELGEPALAGSLSLLF